VSDQHHDSGYTPPTSVVNGVVKTTGILVGAISSPVLITLIIFAAGAIGVIAWIWQAQREGAIKAYTHLVDICLPGREKN
jgi:hypothetical protein